DGWWGRFHDAIPRPQGRGPRRIDATRTGCGQVRETERKIVLHVRENRLQAGPVYPAWTSAFGPRALRVSGERLRRPRATLTAVDADASAAGEPPTGHGLQRHAGERSEERRVGK